MFVPEYSVKTSNLIYCSFDFCALVLCILVLCNYSTSKKIKNRMSRLFVWLTVIILISTVFDALSIITYSVIYCYKWIKVVLRLLNYVFFTFTGIAFYFYTISLVYKERKTPKANLAVATVITIAVVCGAVIAAFDLFGTADVPKIIYESLLYASQLSALIAAFIITLLNRAGLKRAQRVNVYFFIIFNIVANALRQILRTVQLSNFALSVALLIIYVLLQRPEDELDRVSGMFNATTYVARTNERLRLGKPFIAFVCEINNLANVNANFGIVGGNVVIREIAERIKNVMPDNLLLYRLTGARFVINFNDEKEFSYFEKGYLKVCEAPVVVFDTKIRVDAIACKIHMPSVTNKVSEVEDIIKYYRSHNKSLPIVVADKQAVEHSRRRERVVYAIQRALKNNNLEVYYQPIFSVKKQVVDSCEALIRLNDPDLGFISPDEFIPVAEQTGRIVEIGNFVINEVCKFLKEEDPSLYGLKVVDINLSVIQCMHSEIIKDIDSTLAKYGIDRKMVTFEVTETASASSYAVLQSHLEELHKSGFTISLDDFGSGFSSVQHLINFPFDIVKLDKELVWAYMSKPKYEPLKYYMPMLHGIGARIVAEGVETAEMVKVLEELGCDYLQGFYYSKPIPKDEFIAYLKNWSNGTHTA